MDCDVQRRDIEGNERLKCSSISLDGGHIHRGGNHWARSRVERQNRELGLGMISSKAYTLTHLHLR